jgi:TPR repeat protein
VQSFAVDLENAEKDLKAQKKAQLEQGIQQFLALGHFPSIATMSWCFLWGLQGFPNDSDRGLALAEEGMRLGSHDCQGVLAIHYLFEGLNDEDRESDEESERQGIEKNIPGASGNMIRAVSMARESAAKGSMYGQFVVGFVHAEGNGGVAQDYVAAVAQYQLAAAQNFDAAQYFLGLLYAKIDVVDHDNCDGKDSDDEDRDEQIDEEDSFAMQFQGHVRFAGKDHVEALRLFKLAAAQEYSVLNQAVVRVGKCYQKGLGVAVDNFEAFRWYGRVSLSCSDRNRLKILGEHLERLFPLVLKDLPPPTTDPACAPAQGTRSSLSPQLQVHDPKILITNPACQSATLALPHCLFQTAQACAAEAQRLRSRGEFAAAVEQLQQAISRGHLPSRAALADMLLSMEGVDIFDFGESSEEEIVVACLQKAFLLVTEGTRMGCLDCQGMLGGLYLHNITLIDGQNIHDEELSLQLTRQSAETGSKYGQYWFARNRETDAYYWYLLSAMQGYARALWMIGMFFKKRDNEPKALMWLKSAAAQGSGDAMYSISELCKEGSDKEEAHRWYRRARQAGLLTCSSQGGSWDDDDAFDYIHDAAQKGEVARIQRYISADPRSVHEFDNK